MSSAEQTVATSIRFVSVVRIVYGVVALAAPKVWPKVFGLDPDNADARAWNNFLGSRDIAIGVHGLTVAGDPKRHGDAILINQLCEVGDTAVVATEFRFKRPFGLFTAAGIAFNAGMHAIWINARRVRR